MRYLRVGQKKALFHGDLEREMPTGGRLRVDGEKGTQRGPPWRPIKEEERGLRLLCQTGLGQIPAALLELVARLSKPVSS